MSAATSIITTGHAGTGKTLQLVRAAETEVRLGKSVCCSAFTNKAVSVLRRRFETEGVSEPPLRTLSSLIHTPREKAAADQWASMTDKARKRFLKRLLPDESIIDPTDELQSAMAIASLAGGDAVDFVANAEQVEYDVVFVDEASMVKSEDLDLLLSKMRPDAEARLYGDPAQLPPIGARSALDDELAAGTAEHVHMEKVWRTDKAGILALSARVRETGAVGDVRGFPSVGATPRIDIAVCNRADVVLCFANKTRKSLIARMRKARGLSGPPRPGERVVVNDPGSYRNAWWAKRGFEYEVLGLNDVVKRKKVGTYYDLHLATVHGRRHEFRMLAPALGFESEPVKDGEVPRHHHMPLGGKGEHCSNCMEAMGAECDECGAAACWKCTLTWGRCDQCDGALKQAERPDVPAFGRPALLDFAYARSIYKAQGDEFANVALVDDFSWMASRDPAMRRKTLYTAVTRAMDGLIIMGGR